MAGTFARLSLLLPAATLLYGVGVYGAHSDHAGVHAVLPWSAVALFFGVFVLGWAGIPITGALVTVLAAEFSPPWQRRLKRLFVAWVMAWLGVALGLWLWETPFEFVG